MHLLIPYAFCNSEGCAAALPALKLPQLEKLLARLTPEPPDAGDAFSLSPPHERALARALGLPVADGLIPWAAWEALQSGLGGGAWAFITPCHWRVGSKHAAMGGPRLAGFSEQDSRTLLTAMQPYFTEDGIELHYWQPHCWLARSELFAGLATAALERVVGRDVQSWLPQGANAGTVQRLQAEMQMLLYHHPLNDERAARGLLPVNSFWLSGSGTLREAPATPVEAPVVVTTLRDAALNEDWPAWTQAWHAVDATECVALQAALARGEDMQLTLCGERNAQGFLSATQSLFQRMRRRFGTPRAATFLEPL
jgi:hypothetical protein